MKQTFSNSAGRMRFGRIMAIAIHLNIFDMSRIRVGVTLIIKRETSAKSKVRRKYGNASHHQKGQLSDTHYQYNYVYTFFAPLNCGR